MKLVDYVSENSGLTRFWHEWPNHQKKLVTGINGASQTLALVALVQQRQVPVLVVTDTLYHANELASDCLEFLPEQQVYTFPVDESLEAEFAISSPQLKSERLLALEFLLSRQAGIVITSVAGSRYPLTSLTRYQHYHLVLKPGDELKWEPFLQDLVTMGYQREKLVAKPGEFSVRGDIVDIYPLTAENPVRLEFFDQELDSIRCFDVATQRSLANLSEFSLGPATDRLIEPSDFDRAAHTLSQDLHDTDQDEHTALLQSVHDQLQEHVLNEQTRRFWPYLSAERVTLSDYVDKEGIVVLEDVARLQEKSGDMDHEIATWQTEQLAQHLLPHPLNYRMPFRNMIKQDDHRQAWISLFKRGLGHQKFNDELTVPVRVVPQFFSQLPAIKAEFERWNKQQATVILLIHQPLRQTKIRQTLADFEVPVMLNTTGEIIPGQAQIISGTLRHGLEFPYQRLVILTEHELFNHVRTTQPVKRQVLTNAERLKSYNDLKVGDYVVHAHHGIGRYDGMQTLEVDGVHRDYLTITYLQGAQLFIPVDQLNLVSKYVAAEGKAPKLNRLGGTEWQKTKRRVAAKVEDIADDLIALYAKREALQGYAFPPDDALQHEFEEEFPYQETPDQARSAAEIKRDMERPHPMDRLLVGDVGFGKTEVALRAAFKAASIGKQVAILVPTTILAQQHYETMQQRFADFPIKVGIMSRFQTRTQQHETLTQLKQGQLDIVVGTHRLLSADVKFADLGLLVIDEEQRFGVKHKEKIKQLRSQVDVLTLTATPIPRTLHMSMIGVRDLSVIETPPTNRYPVQTYVLEQHDGAIREAIERELDRGGQVFYLHNRVQDMEAVVTRLQTLVPDARIGIAHGQMTELQLENVMYQFLQGDLDVLVTTTIIETGVDMPNVNTLIVEQADHYGLSQLYQLRGRVGRSHRIAYAYLMYQPQKNLSEVSEKRLQAIKDFTELGAGFKIAMRDLAIRGAGNLLGQQQHGFIDSVGYDLYTELLNEAVQKRRHQQAKTALTQAELNLNVNAYLPQSYISDERQKIELYKRLREADSDETITEIETDLIDRFGDFPTEVATLLTVTRLKKQSDATGVVSIIQHPDRLVITLSAQALPNLQGDQLFKALAHLPYHAEVKFDDHRYYQIVVQVRQSNATLLGQLMAFLVALQQTQVNKENANT